MHNDTYYAASFKPCYIIGLDVGGTHIDATLLFQETVVASYKTLTTADITKGMLTALTHIITYIPKTDLPTTRVMLGTTHLLNALLQLQVESIAIIRLGAPATTAIPPLTGWPLPLRAKISGFVEIIAGGHEYDGREIAPLAVARLQEIAHSLQQKGLFHVAITGVFAHVNPQQEKAAAQLMQAINSNFNISLSHTISGLGILERENANILNAALMPVFTQFINRISQAWPDLKHQPGQLYISHNDGTLQPINLHLSSKAQDQLLPIFTLNSGTTNSMLGAQALANPSKKIPALVADIGGTSADIGLLQDGFPLQTNGLTHIAGVPVNLPHTVGKSIALGGGSHIRLNSDGSFQIGPQSVGYHLTTAALSFGGDTLTITDIAILKKRMVIKGMQPDLLPSFDPLLLKQIDDSIHQLLANSIIDVWCSIKNPPAQLLLVGGGAALFDCDKLAQLLNGKIKTIIVPPHSDVANAIGATQAKISGNHIEIYDFAIISRDQAYQDATQKAKREAILKGADPDSIYVSRRNEEQIRYVPGIPTEVRVQVIGDIPQSYSSPQLEEINLEPQKLLSEPNLSEMPSLAPFNAAVIDTLNYSTLAPEIKKRESAPDIQAILSKTAALTEQQLLDRALGSAYLGSGGGGDTRLGELMIKELLSYNKMIQIIPLGDLPDTATVICFGIMGSPTVFEEKLPSLLEISALFDRLELKLGKKIDAMIKMEIGGVNGLLCEIASALVGIPVVDADCMGRAFPGINMVTPLIYGAIKDHMAILASATGLSEIQASDAFDLENKARQLTANQGGVVFIGYMPMDGKTAKKVCIPHTSTVTEQIGYRIRLAKTQNQDALLQLNDYLKTTDYKKAEEIFHGRITDLRRLEQDGFSVGGLVITQEQNKGNSIKAEVVFQNENLQLYIRKPNGVKVIIAQVPDLIVIVDQQSLLPISCGQLKQGQKVAVIHIASPSLMLTAEAMPIVGPSAYAIEHLSKLLEDNALLEELNNFSCEH